MVINTPVQGKFSLHSLTLSIILLVFLKKISIQCPKGVFMTLSRLKPPQSNPECECEGPGGDFRPDSPSEVRFPRDTGPWSPVSDVGEELVSQKDAKHRRVNKICLTWSVRHEPLWGRKRSRNFYKSPLHVTIKDKPQILSMSLSGWRDLVLLIFLFFLSIRHLDFSPQTCATSVVSAGHCGVCGTISASTLGRPIS